MERHELVALVVVIVLLLLPQPTRAPILAEAMSWAVNNAIGLLGWAGQPATSELEVGWVPVAGDVLRLAGTQPQLRDALDYGFGIHVNTSTGSVTTTLFDIADNLVLPVFIIYFPPGTTPEQYLQSLLVNATGGPGR